MKSIDDPAQIRKNRWQLQEAKNCLSQVVDLAIRKGPQTITLRGKEAAVVVSAEEYRKLTHVPTRLSDFFRQSPLHGVQLDLERSRDTPREVEL